MPGLMLNNLLMMLETRSTLTRSSLSASGSTPGDYPVCVQQLRLFRGRASFVLASLVASPAPTNHEDVDMLGCLNSAVSGRANNITLFAPTDAAIGRLSSSQLAALTSDMAALKETLSYHALLKDVVGLHRRGINRLQDKVIMSSNNLPIRINIYKLVHSISAEGVNITERAIRVSNGYVHALDGIMKPPQGDVVSVVQQLGEFNSLVSLLSTAGLVDAINADMNITVFAPNDAAFQQLDPSIKTYLTNNLDDLKEVLLYHIVERMTLYSIGMRHTITFHTADKRHDNLMVIEDFASGNIMVNDAKIVAKDISATNGVIHVIDKVLIPLGVLLKMESQGLTIG
ncbi:transforming growth factor-beta-induced protein ig-h3 [Plakobranchus ocellatus]|uniref:Transforming growth factor-beta-induced protein ig-h3 n=1 Tax=Plakobranchus ocellatus TaxID=259542 RepID=A0AAV4BHK0_9GAST|nr:transforming growth factor-beta-induced protein ig-h3 [Plakobranchus ocellatus]